MTRKLALKPPKLALKPTGSKPAPKGRAAARLAARRLFDAQVGRRDAEKAWDAGIAAAIKAEVIPDRHANPEPVGTHRVTYADDEIQVTLSVIAGNAGINLPAFILGLIKAGVDPKLISRQTKKHATETKPAHRFTVSLI